MHAEEFYSANFKHGLVQYGAERLLVLYSKQARGGEQQDAGLPRVQRHLRPHLVLFCLTSVEPGNGMCLQRSPQCFHYGDQDRESSYRGRGGVGRQEDTEW